MKPLKLIFFLSLLTVSLKSFSQIGITSYSIYALGINTSQNHRLSGEIKTFANRAVDEIYLEIDGFYNFKAKTYHRFSIGVGVNFIPFRDFDRVYALTIPASLEIFPFQEFKKVSLLFEVSPEILPEDGVNLRSLWGIRYTFGK